jgi:hypothetical protein
MRFTFAVWILSRAVVFVAFLFASNHPLASTGNWDGAWYGSIAQHGYGFAQHGEQHDAAYFPLYPLLASLLLRIGIGWPLAGVLLNNAAFLGALFVLYTIARSKWDITTARWCVAVACTLSPSLFASNAYREGLYLFLSALALWWTLRGARFAGGLAGAAASATSSLGIALALALVTEAIVQRRGARAIACSALAFAGLGFFALFCFLRFGDALAFVHAAHGWRAGGIDIGAWLRVLASLSTPQGFRQNIMVVVLVPLAGLAILMQRNALGMLLTVYGVLAIALIFVAGEPISADRYAYAAIPVLIAVAHVLLRGPVAGAAALIASLGLLAYDTVQFARFYWVA